eukprot:2418007-Rhodomonas_salina.2
MTNAIKTPQRITITKTITQTIPPPPKNKKNLDNDDGSEGAGGLPHFLQSLLGQRGTFSPISLCTVRYFRSSYEPARYYVVAAYERATRCPVLTWRILLAGKPSIPPEVYEGIFKRIGLGTSFLLSLLLDLPLLF